MSETESQILRYTHRKWFLQSRDSETSKMIQGGKSEQKLLGISEGPLVTFTCQSKVESSERV